MNLIVLMLILLNPLLTSPKDNCSCKKAPQNTSTCWGYVEQPISNGGTVRQIRGRVLAMNDEPLADALIEVFKRQDIKISEEAHINKNRQKRIALCKANSKGEFCFKGITAGKYEIRASCVAGFDAHRTFIVLAPTGKRKVNKEVIVRLAVSM